MFVFSACLILGLPAVAAKEAEADAMTDILADSELSRHRIGSTQTVENDGYIGIPVEITVYYDATRGAAKPGYGGTPVILYIVNINEERVGTEADTVILSSMLSRGYAVAVADYKNHESAVCPSLEYSVQKLRTRLKNGDFFTDKALFPNGAYHESHAVAAGCNITLNHVYYEIDRHGEDGALEKIVETWNYDFRACYAETVVRWTKADGSRKETQNGIDGSAPVWYADSGASAVDNTNGSYIKIKHTFAKSIEDCVKRDGSPLDLNLYAHIITPSNPHDDVPLMILAGSSEHLASGYAQEDRPYLVGYMLRGYAVATYDFEYVPMARNDHYGYFAGDAARGITGVNGTFALGTYNRGLYNTAAIRYFRHLSLSDHATYPFRNDKIGVFGNSKGGFQTFLGSEELQTSTTLADLGEGKSAADLEAYLDRRVSDFLHERYFVVMDPEETVTAPDGTASHYTSYNGNTRYQNGKTADTVTAERIVRGGELQPWLTYTDDNGMLREIPSGVEFVYSSCGGVTDEIGKNHAPLFTSVNYYDSYGSAYTTQNYIANLARIYDIPSLFFTVPLEHSLVSGTDIHHGTDTYRALFAFSDYYLKDSPVGVVYTEPQTGEAALSAVSPFLIKFSGAIPEEEIRKVTVLAEDGTPAKGEWVPAYGKTEWSFRPTAWKGGTAYTVTIPASLKGDNGRETGNAYTFSLRTEAETAEDFTLLSPASVTQREGLSVSFSVPGGEDGGNCQKLRFRVTNNAANTAKIYAAASPTDTAGTLLGTVMLRGAGVYEYDVTDYVRSFPAGSELYFLIRAEKASSDTVVYRNDFESKDGILAGTSAEPVKNVEEGDGISALKFVFRDAASGKYGYRAYNGWFPTLFQTTKPINGGTPVTRADLGRRFTLTLRVFDTVSRPLQLWMNDCTDGKTYTVDFDYNRAVFRTTAGEWKEYSLDYTVYESDYGVAEQIKAFRCLSRATGSTEMPVFVDSLIVTEHVTDIVISDVSLVSAREGTFPYRAPSSANTDEVFEVNGVGYADFDSAANAVERIGYAEFQEHPERATIKLLKNHELGDASLRIPPSLKNLTLDLCGYRLRLRDSSLLSFAATDAETVTLTVKNGAVILGNQSLILHEHADSRAAGKIYRLQLEQLYLGTSRVFDGGRVGAAKMMTSESSAKIPVTQELLLVGCTLSFSRNTLPKTPITLFPRGSAEALSTRYRMAGCEVRLSSFVTLSFAEDPKEIVWGTDDAGSASRLILPESVEPPKDMTIMSDTGYATFAVTEHTDGECTYQPQSAKYSTKYGVIPDDKTPEEWPFAVFMNGEPIGFYKSFSIGSDNRENALFCAYNVSRGDSEREVQILLRRDYDMTADGASDTVFYNLAQIGGTLVIDLGGHTLVLKPGVPLLTALGKGGYDPVLKKTYVYDSRISVIGGHIVANEALVKISSSNVANYTKRKDFYITFDGTTITVPATSRQNLLVSHTTGTNQVNTTYGALFDVRFCDCEIDVGAAGTAKTLVHGVDEALMNNLSVTVCGGNITASTLENCRLFDMDDNDRFVFAKNDTGAYTTLTLPTDASLPVLGAKNEAGVSLTFGNGEEKGTNTVYSLSEVFITEYGIIPSEYDSDTYPFALFMDGAFLGAYSCWSQDNADSALRGVWLQMNGNKGKGKTAQVVLRRNYTMGDGDKLYNNLAHLNGTVIFDFGSFTFTLASGKPLFNARAQTAGTVLVSESNFVIKGGTVVTNGVPAVLGFTEVNASRQDVYTEAKKFRIVFHETTFRIPSENGKSIFFASDKAVYDNELGADFYLTLNSCTIDTTQNTFVKELFCGTDSTRRNRLHLDVNGGSLLAASLDGVKFVALDDADSFLFGKDAGGNYLSLTLPSTAAAPSDAYPSDDGERLFTLSKTENGLSLYLLSKAPEKLRIRGACLWIREDVSVVYTAVIPDGYTSVYMMFDFLGKTYRVYGTDNGDGIFSFPFEHILPQQLGDNIRATLYATRLGEEESVTKETYSVREYCIYQLENSTDARLVTLLSDMLIMGAEAQRVAGYKTDALVTDGLTLNAASSFVSPPDSVNKLSLEGESSGDLSWQGAGLRLENQMALYLTFRAASVENLNLRVTVAGREKVYAADDFIECDGCYRVYILGIAASEFNEAVEAVFLQSGTTVGQTLSYSVNSYIYAKQATAEAPVQGLLRAIYNYGESVYAFAHQK